MLEESKAVLHFFVEAGRHFSAFAESFLTKKETNERVERDTLKEVTERERNERAKYKEINNNSNPLFARRCRLLGFLLG